MVSGTSGTRAFSGLIESLRMSPLTPTPSPPRGEGEPASVLGEGQSPQKSRPDTAGTGNTSGTRYSTSFRVSSFVSALTVSSSGAPGFRSSPPTEQPRRSVPPMAAGEYPAARISGTTTGPRQTA